MDLKKLVRPNIYGLKPYSCARDEFQGEASVFLDANENPMNAPYNRYPDPLQLELKKKISKIKGVRISQIMLGNGSDEAIDLVFRIFCEPGKDNVVAIEPSYGMYGVCADVNNIKYISVKLKEETFELDADKLLAATNENTKVVFLCSPNNPTSNLLNRSEVQKVINGFDGIVVIDEAYEDFSSEESWISELDKNPNIIVLQTFSKAWAMASVRCGMAFGSEEIISFFNKVKYPYNVNFLTQSFVNEQLNLIERKNAWVEMLLEQRIYLRKELDKLNAVNKIYPSESNFLLVSVSDAENIYKYLTNKGIIVRNRNKVSLCLGCLRITVGTKEENNTLIEALKNYNK